MHCKKTLMHCGGTDPDMSKQGVLGTATSVTMAAMANTRANKTDKAN